LIPFLAVLLIFTFSARSAVYGKEGESLVANGDFEAHTSGEAWPDQWEHPKAGVRWIDEGGNHFLRLFAAEPGKMVMLYHRVGIPASAKALKLTWRQRITGLKPGKQPWFDARIMLDFKDASGNKLEPAPPAPYSRNSTDGWIDRDVEFLVPAGAKTLEFMPALFQVETGTFDLDDVQLFPVDPAPLQKADAVAAAEKAAKQKKAADANRARAAAALRSNGSLVPNGNFEADAEHTGWPDQWSHAKAGVTWEMEDGNHFLRLTAAKPGEMVMLYQSVDLPAGVAALELSWRQRVTDLQIGRQPWFDARIMLEFKDAAGKSLPQKPSPPYTQKNTGGWVERRTKFLVPSEAVALVLMPTLFKVEKGTFDLDDIVLKPTEAGPLIAAAKAADEADRRAAVSPEQPNAAKWPAELHVEGRHVLDKGNNEIWLQGVNAGGLESLAQERHVMRSALVGVDQWKANVIRLPVREDFWFGRGPYQADGGKAYREMVDEIVTLVANRHAYLLLDLHRFHAPRPEHVEFWKDAATRYKNHPAVLFDLFNEPHDISWQVWRDGGFVPEPKSKADEDAFLSDEEKAKSKQGFQSPGMQGLLDAVRQTGARNIVVAGGLSWAGDLSGIANGWALTDKGGNGIMYGWHVYNWHKDWQGRVLAAAEKFPIFVGEVGADVKKMDFIPAAAQEDPYAWVPDMLGFIQQRKFNWTAWCLHPAATPLLISDWNYTPTPYWGVFVKEALSGKHFELKRMR